MVLAVACGGPQLTVEQKAEVAAQEEVVALAKAVDAGVATMQVVADSPSPSWVSSVTFTADPAVLFSTPGGAVYRLDLRDGAIANASTVKDAAGLEFVPGGTLGVTIEGAAPRVIEVRSSAEIIRFADWGGASFMSISPNGEHLLIARGSAVGVWNLAEQASLVREGENVEDFLNRQAPRRVITLPSDVSAMTVGDSNEFVVALDDASAKGTVYRWVPESPQDLAFVTRTNGTVRSLVISADEGFLAVINEDGGLFVLQKGKKGFARWALDRKVRGAAWTGSGALVLIGEGGALSAVDPTTGDEKWATALDSPVERCFVRGEKVVCTDGRVLFLVDGLSGALVASAAAWDGHFLTMLPNGAHAGNAKTSWVASTAGGTSTAFSPGAWAKLSDVTAVAEALRGWGQ